MKIDSRPFSQRVFGLAAVGSASGRLIVITLTALAILLATMSTARAGTVCGDTCVVDGGTASTALGPVTVSVSDTDVVTVTLIPTVAKVIVLGVPVAIPPGPPGFPGYARTTITTAGAIVNIDTVVIPPGPPGRLRLPDVAIISIHPPGPCRAQTAGNTVTFTPVMPRGPAG
jgi:hypothetical protein